MSIYTFDRYGIGGSRLQLQPSQRLVDIDCSEGAVEYHQWEMVPIAATIHVAGRSPALYYPITSAPSTDPS